MLGCLPAFKGQVCLLCRRGLAWPMGLVAIGGRVTREGAGRVGADSLASALHLPPSSSTPCYFQVSRSWLGTSSLRGTIMGSPGQTHYPHSVAGWLVSRPGTKLQKNGNLETGAKRWGDCTPLPHTRNVSAELG